jgi:glyoxylase-like metal-dependent hydrolase (beta-lactamase superfamily II)
MADEKGLPSRLTAAVFTHLHDDHTGWLRADGGLARLLSGTTLMASETELRLSPLSTSGNWQIAGNGSEIVPGVTAISTPGHTLGHMSYMVESRGQRLLCFGDVMHSPIQVSRPTLNSCFEADPSASLLSRERTLEDLTDTGVIGVGMHFGDVVFGHVATLQGERTWLPIH